MKLFDPSRSLPAAFQLFLLFADNGKVMICSNWKTDTRKRHKKFSNVVISGHLNSFFFNITCYTFPAILSIDSLLLDEDFSKSDFFSKCPILDKPNTLKKLFFCYWSHSDRSPQLQVSLFASTVQSTALSLRRITQVRNRGSSVESFETWEGKNSKNRYLFDIEFCSFFPIKLVLSLTSEY